MNEYEIESVLRFAVEICGAQWEQCDESDHLYHNEEYIGGYAGDMRKFFICDGDHVAKLVQMMDAYGWEKGDEFCLHDPGDIDASDCPRRY